MWICSWFVITKRTDGTSDWYLMDKVRGAKRLSANSTTSQQNAAVGFGPTGFTVDGVDTALNVNGAEYIYLAIADEAVFFYDEEAGQTVTNYQLTKRYGVDPLTTDLKKYGIYPLTEQPSYAVAAYVRENGHYKPIRSYQPEVTRTNQAITDVQASFEARIAALESGE